jgi:hypothetical protein
VFLLLALFGKLGEGDKVGLACILLRTLYYVRYMKWPFRRNPKKKDEGESSAAVQEREANEPFPSTGSGSQTEFELKRTVWQNQFSFANDFSALMTAITQVHQAITSVQDMSVPQRAKAGLGGYGYETLRTRVAGLSKTATALAIQVPRVSSSESERAEYEKILYVY